MSNKPLSPQKNKNLFIQKDENESLLNKLRITSQLMNKMLIHYDNYPTSPDLFINWQTKTENYIEQIKSKLQ